MTFILPMVGQLEYKLAYLRFSDAWPLNIVRGIRRNEGDYWFAPLPLMT